MAAMGSKEAQSYLIDPMNAPEPSAETGPGSHFGSTMAASDSKGPNTTTEAVSSSPLRSRNPFRNDSPTPSPTTTRPAPSESRGSPKEPVPDYRTSAFSAVDHRPRRTSADHPPSYTDAIHTAAGSSRRRGSSLRERYPGDDSHKPLEIIRKDSKKAHRSPHLNKRHLPGPDVIDKLDPAIGGHAYHHEGPYDAALLARNTDPKYAPLAAVEGTNEEALKATPRENVRDAVEGHKPLDGTAFVPPGMPDQFGRMYEYEEGADLQHEEGAGGGPGYKRWGGKDYDPEDLKGASEPAFSLDRALKAHKIDDNGIEMEDRSQLMQSYHDQRRKGTLDPRHPVDIAGDDGKYVELQNKNMADDGVKRSGSLRAAGEGLKKRIGSLRHRNRDD